MRRWMMVEIQGGDGLTELGEGHYSGCELSSVIRAFLTPIAFPHSHDQPSFPRSALHSSTTAMGKGTVMTTPG